MELNKKQKIIISVIVFLVLLAACLFIMSKQFDRIEDENDYLDSEQRKEFTEFLENAEVRLIEAGLDAVLTDRGVSVTGNQGNPKGKAVVYEDKEDSGAAEYEVIFWAEGDMQVQVSLTGKELDNLLAEARERAGNVAGIASMFAAEEVSGEGLTTYFDSCVEGVKRSLEINGEYEDFDSDNSGQRMTVYDRGKEGFEITYGCTGEYI